MRWEILTEQINGLEYVVGCKLESEYLEPEGPRHLSAPLSDYMDENGKPRYHFDGKTLIEKKIVLTEKEEREKIDKENQRILRGKYPEVYRMRIMDMAIQNMAEGKKLPPGYIEYHEDIMKAERHERVGEKNVDNSEPV